MGDDSDRAAILARRQYFIALALSGLATTACAHKRKPQVCLNVAPEAERQTDDEWFDFGDEEDISGDEEDISGETLMPQSCLQYSRPQPRPRTDMRLDTTMDDDLSAVPAAEPPAPPEPD